MSTSASTNPVQRARFLCGHVLDVLRTLPDQSVDCCVTSPPYWGLRDYGNDPQIWGGRVHCKHVWASEPSAKNGNGNEEQAGKGELGTQPAVGALGSATCSKCNAWRGNLGHEADPHAYVEHLVEVFREVRRVLKHEGTLWLNLGDSYAGSWGGYRSDGPWRRNPTGFKRRAYETSAFLPPTARTTLKARNLVGIPWRVALALQADGWILRSDIIWNKPNCTPESAKNRPTRSHEYVFMLAKQPRYYYDYEAIAEPIARATYRRINQSGTSDDKDVVSAQRTQAKPAYLRNRRTVWNVPVMPFRGMHFATYPKELIRPCILAGCLKGGTVLDPFVGSGTTAVVCREEVRSIIGIDLNEEYLNVVNSRLSDQKAS